MGIRDYRWFLDRTLYWETNEGFKHKYPRLSDLYDLFPLGLSDSVQTRLDSLYKRDGLRPALSKMVDLSALGLPDSARARLDSLYDREGRLPGALRAIRSGEPGGVGCGSGAPRFPLQEGWILHLPLQVTQRLREWTRREERSCSTCLSKYRSTPCGKSRPGCPRRSISRPWGCQESPRPNSIPCTSIADESRCQRRSICRALGLSAATRTRLDSLYADTESQTWMQPWRQYDLAKERLEGRVLYWYLAHQLIDGFERGENFAIAQRRWGEYQAANPYPEYEEAVKAALEKALKLQPGQQAPEFTLHDLDGQPVSLSQFKGQVVSARLLGQLVRAVYHQPARSPQTQERDGRPDRSSSSTCPWTGMRPRGGRRSTNTRLEASTCARKGAGMRTWPTPTR